MPGSLRQPQCGTDRSGGRTRLTAAWLAIAASAIGLARGQEPTGPGTIDTGALHVRIEAARGPCYVGQGIELGIAVTGRDQRPRLEIPAIHDARIWSADTSFQPVSASAIGAAMTGENVYLTRLRIVPGKAGTLDVPPIVARLEGRAGKSRGIRLPVEAVPIEGRPGEFLGGVGEFAVRASVSASSVRLGQELIYRITLTGPAAWGSRTPPELDRLKRLPSAPRIDPLPEEATDEPPMRTFVFRVRPTRAGPAVLPPVAIAAFDPRTERFFTKATQGLPITVAAVPVLDPRFIEVPNTESGRPRTWLGIALMFSFLGAIAAMAGRFVVRSRRLRRVQEHGPRAARRFARRFAAELDQVTGQDHRGEESSRELARRVMAGLTEYTRIGLGRAAGALTPEEAANSIWSLTDSETLARQAAVVVAGCDRSLFSGRDGEDEAVLATGAARELFSALGQAAVVATRQGANQRTASSRDRETSVLL